MIPVSYTHLDVYKRQGVACGDGRELRGREVLVADHAAITVDVDVRDFAHEQLSLIHILGL